MACGRTVPFSGFDELDSFCRTQEARFKTREEVLGLLEANSLAYIAWLDALPPEKLSSSFETPMGTFAMIDAITFPADHLRAHASQIEYIQTIYGDRSWHIG